MTTEDRARVERRLQQARIERIDRKLADVRMEQARQMEWAGVRLGVFARLKELDRKERSLIRQRQALAARTPEPQP